MVEQGVVVPRSQSEIQFIECCVISWLQIWHLQEGPLSEQLESVCAYIKILEARRDNSLAARQPIRFVFGAVESSVGNAQEQSGYGDSLGWLQRQVTDLVRPLEQLLEPYLPGTSLAVDYGDPGLTNQIH